MLSARDAGMVRRDPRVPGLAVLFDPDAFLELLSEEFPFLWADAAVMQYVRYKPGTSCICSFRVSGAEETADVSAKAVALGRPEKLRHWHARRARPARRPRRRLSERWQLGLSRFPDDRRLKALARLHSVSRRKGVLAAAFPGHPEWSGSDLLRLRYKPERRYVAALVQDGTPAAVLKMYDRSGYEDARARAGWFQSRGPLWIPASVGGSEAHRLLGFEWITGHALQEEMLRSLAAAELAGSALAELHEQDTPGCVSHDGGPAAAMRAAAEGVAAVCPDFARRARRLANRVGSELDASSREARPSHGDFYAEQVIVTGARAAILDFDRACLAHPAADVGTFAAHLRRAAVLGVLSPGQADAVLDALLRGYSRRRPVPAAAQLRFHTAAALLRLAPEPFRRRERNWDALTEQLLDEADRVLASAARETSPRVTARVPAKVVVDDTPGLASNPEWDFLHPALDPTAARRQLGAPLARAGATSARLRRIHVSRHKPRRRCIVEYEFETGSGKPEDGRLVLVGKTRMKGLDANAQFALESLWHAGFNPSRSSICVPQPIGAVGAWRMTLQVKVPGIPANELLAGRDRVRTATRIAEAIHTLHSRGPNPIKRHTIGDELRILRERLPHLAGRVTPGRIDGLLARCEQLAARLPRAEPRPIHRDFYPVHVLVDGERLWLIDLDLYCGGDPALDVGNFLAHMIEERVRRGECGDEAPEAERAFESRYAQLAGPRVIPAIRAWTTLALVRHVHLSTQFGDRHHTTETLLELCEKRLSAGVESRIYA